MKTKIIAILLIICTLVMCISSCNQPTPPDNEDNTSVTSQNADASDTPTSDGTEKDYPATDTLALQFSDYSDFMLFGTTGELDPNKYTNAELFVSHFKLPAELFFDVKKLLDLPDLAEGLEEEIIIQERNAFEYIVYSADGSNRAYTEYYVTVRFKVPPTEERKYAASVIPITQMSDMTEQNGTFVYKRDSFDAIYYKADQVYRFVQLSNNNMSIQLIFKSGGLTQAQIAEKFGNTVAELFSDDSAKLDKALDEKLAFIQNNTNK